MALFRCKKKKEEVVTYYGIISEAPMISLNTYMMAYPSSSVIGNYALFSGMLNNYNINTISKASITNRVDSYDTSLTYGAVERLHVASTHEFGRACHAATTVGNYALFGGGVSYNNFSFSTSTVNIVDAYDTSLTHTLAPNLVGNIHNKYFGRACHAATTVGNYALFGGGFSGKFYNMNSSTNTNTIDAYDISLTHTIVDIPNMNASASATTVGNYALFGGENGAYDSSLTRIQMIDMKLPVYAATTVGNYAIFPTSHQFEFVDTSLTRSNLKIPTSGYFPNLNRCSATTIGNYALFGGGGINFQSSYVMSVDTSLTYNAQGRMKIWRNNLGAATIGNYALFAYGDINNNNTSYYANSIDVYTVM